MGSGCVASRQGRKGDAKKEAGRQERGCKKGAAGTPPALSRLPRPRSPCRAGSARPRRACRRCPPARGPGCRSEEHTSELQSLMRISYAVFCLKKNKEKTKDTPK